MVVEGRKGRAGLVRMRMRTSKGLSALMGPKLSSIFSSFPLISFHIPTKERDSFVLAPGLDPKTIPLKINLFFKLYFHLPTQILFTLRLPVPEADTKMYPSRFCYRNSK
jgi:hypothetical protein